MEEQEQGSISLQEEQTEKAVQQPPPLKCPRCESDNTKFCYYNNYSLSQPRHFCRACRRFWTQGGMLRNIPAGNSSSRKGKRAKKASFPSSRSVPKSASPSLRYRSRALQIKPIHFLTDPIFHVNENADFLGSYGNSATAMSHHHLSSFPASSHQPLNYTGELVTNLPYLQSYNLMGALGRSNMYLYQDNTGLGGFNPPSHDHDAWRFYDEGTSNNLINPSSGSDQTQTRWYQSFVESMTRKNTGSGTSIGNPDTNIMNSYGVRSPYLNLQDQYWSGQNLPCYGPRPQPYTGPW